MAFITVEIELPDDLEPEEDGRVSVTQVSASVASEGVSADDSPTLILMAVQQILVGRMRTHLDATDPLANPDMVEALAIMNARVDLIGRVMTLPLIAPTGSIETSI